MAEGGQLPWKVQVIDESRGPPADYSSIASPLPKPPSGVEWQRDEKTREWRLVRVDDDDAEKRRYRLEVGTAWNERTGRVAPTLVPVPRQDGGLVVPAAEEHGSSSVAGAGAGTGTGTEKDTAEEKGGSEEDDSSEKPAVEGVDYLLHTVLPTDTLPGLCLRYRLKPTALRRLNRFSGSNLRLAPSRLIIPLGPNGEGLNGGSVRAQDKSTPEYKLHAFLAEFPRLRQSEGRAYLELADWDLNEALESAREDDCWERTEGKAVVAKEEKEDYAEEIEVDLDGLALREEEEGPVGCWGKKSRPESQTVGCWGKVSEKAHKPGSLTVMDVHVAVPAIGIEMIEPASNGTRTSERNQTMAPAPLTDEGGGAEDLRTPLLRKIELPQIT